MTIMDSGTLENGKITNPMDKDKKYLLIKVATKDLLSMELNMVALVLSSGLMAKNIKANSNKAIWMDKVD